MKPFFIVPPIFPLGPMINYEESTKFKKDLKKLLKRFKSLSEDLEVVKDNVIRLNHILAVDNLSTFEIPGFSSANFSFWKIKKFACKSFNLPGNPV